MKSARLKISLYCFIITIAFLVPSFIMGAQGMTNDSKKDCVITSTKEGADCKIFNDGICLKGKIKDGACVHESNALATILMVLGFTALLISIVYLILGLVGKKGKK